MGGEIEGDSAGVARVHGLAHPHRWWGRVAVRPGGLKAAWARDAVYQVNQAVIVDAAVAGQADFAGAAGGDAFAAILHGVFQAAQRVGVQLGGGEAFIAGKAAAVDAFGDHHLCAATPCQVDQGLAFAQVLGAAGHVHGHWRLLGGELQFVEQVGADEAHRVVQV